MQCLVSIFEYSKTYSLIKLLKSFTIYSPSHPISPSALVSLVSSLSPLGSVPSVRVTNCPIPVDPLAALFGSLGLNVSAVEVLQMNYVPRQSSEDLQGLF